MSNLDLDIVRKGTKTHTRFRMKWYETIVFHNWESKASLTVTINPDGTGPVLSENGDPVEGGFMVPPLGSRSFTILPDYRGAYFEYTAQIEGAGGADPIVIIER